jgi:5-methylcytosine-specific restriction endonuclease McrA
MTEAGFRSWIVSGLRAKSRWWKPMHAAKNKAKTGRRVTNPATGKLCQSGICAGCGAEVPLKDLQMDHIEPIVDPNVGFVSWDLYVERMFPEEDGYQALCKPCHKQKTADERKISTERKRREKLSNENS